VQTHLPPVPLWLLVACATVFFIFVPGRMVPAMAIMTSAVQPHLRGTFLSINGAVQQLFSGIAAYIGGAMIAQDAGGHVVGYGNVGLLAMGATLVTMVLVGRIRMQGTHDHRQP
jgi:predicted MFS family arabinose efflux permease